MKVIEKIKLLKSIANILTEKFDLKFIDIFLNNFEVGVEFNPEEYNINLTEYIIERLGNSSVSELKKIADELEINTKNIIMSPPKNWEKTSSVKAFISHISETKDLAKRTKDVLMPYNIDCFVAHEDIKPSKEWQEEIKKALDTMDFFISIHTKGFSKKIWCQQEVGYAVARNVEIIPIKFDEDPEGFIGKIQALNRYERKAEDIAKDILNILKDSEKTNNLYISKIQEYEPLDDDLPF